MGLCGIGGKLNSSGYKSKFLFAAKQKQKHTHTKYNDLFPALD